MFVEGLFSLLSSDPGIVALLGTLAKRGDAGIYPSIAPDEPLLPYVLYSLVHSDPVISYQGTNPTTEYRFQFSCFGSNYLMAKRLANAVKNVLDGFTGTLNDPDNVFLMQSIKLSEHDEVETEFKATLHAVLLDYHFIVNSPK